MSEVVTFPDGTRVVLEPPSFPGPAPAHDGPRLCYAAAHLVMRAGYRQLGHTQNRPGPPDSFLEWIDFEATMAIRRQLADRGFGIAEAMDTAQRFELGWPASARLIDRCGALDLAQGFVAGAGSDSVPADARPSAKVDATIEQVHHIERAGGHAVLLTQPWLCEPGRTPDEWVDFYGAVLAAARGPLILHWLGPAFHPAMEHAFPGDSFTRIMAADPSKLRGCKLSLLDLDLERSIRRQIARHEQVVFTGDDFHFGELIVGDGADGSGPRTAFGARSIPFGSEFSHALLGVLGAVADPAARALTLLGDGQSEASRALFTRCETVGRILFETPTPNYKAGVALLAWLNDWQPRLSLPNSLEEARDVDHCRRLVAAAASAGAFRDVALTAERLRNWLAGARD